MKEGKARVRFRESASDGDGGMIDMPVESVRQIRSSNGATEQRITVRTPFRIGGNDYPCDLTLTDRAAMRFPMLLGREAIRGRFMVDPGRSFIFGRLNIENHGNKTK